MNNHFSVFLFLFLGFSAAFSQNNSLYQYSGAAGNINAITTAVPFLTIIPDARAGGLGDAGISSSPDANSQQYNPAKYVFNAGRNGISLSYTPWLISLVDDINLGYLSGYHKFDSLRCIAASFKYLSLGEISYTGLSGIPLGTYYPYEFSSDISYSRKLSDMLSIGTAVRYIFSDIGFQTPHYKNGTSLACDISLFYSKKIRIFDNDSRFNFGLSISNIGSKISYNDSIDQKDFIPTNLGLGPALTMPLSNSVSITFLGEIKKLLVPTPPVYQIDTNGLPLCDPSGNPVILAGKNPDVTVLSGILQSFSDAPGGFREEIREINYSFGTEISFREMYFGRSGFFWEDKTKGNRKFFTVGAGIKYKRYQFDIAYLIVVDQRNPLEKTFRFSFLFYFD